MLSAQAARKEELAQRINRMQEVCRQRAASRPEEPAATDHGQASAGLLASRMWLLVLQSCLAHVGGAAGPE